MWAPAAYSMSCFERACCFAAGYLCCCCMLPVACAGDAANEQLWVDKYKPRNTQVGAARGACGMDAMLSIMLTF
jgi:hypothetical protein